MSAALMRRTYPSFAQILSLIAEANIASKMRQLCVCATVSIMLQQNDGEVCARHSTGFTSTADPGACVVIRFHCNQIPKSCGSAAHDTW